MRRRVVLNLTPLLDLLLIMVFAYQINTWVVASEVKREAKEKAAEISDELVDEVFKTTRLAKMLEQLRAEFNEVKRTNESMKRTVENSKRYAEILEENLAQSFRLLLRFNEKSTGVLSDSECRQIGQLLKAATGRITELRENLDRFQRMTELFTFYVINLKEDYLLELQTVSGRTERVMLGQLDEIQKNVENALLRFPPPRDVLVVFFKYGDVLVIRREAVLNALERLTASGLPAKYPERLIYLVEEGYSYDE